MIIERIIEFGILRLNTLIKNKNRSLIQRVQEIRKDDKLRHYHKASPKGKIEIARKLLKRNMAIDEIVEDTGLSREEIEALHAESQSST